MKYDSKSRREFMTIHLSDSSSDSDQDLWENEMVYLTPNQIWVKPSYKTCILINASITVRPENFNEAHGIVQCIYDNQTITICSLFPQKPSQKIQIAWGPDQNMRFINIGNHPVTLALLIKTLSIL